MSTALRADRPGDGSWGPAFTDERETGGGFSAVLALVYVAALTVEAGIAMGPTAATAVYLATSALAAVWLAVRHPTDYVLFSIATWIGASEVRRVTDWLAGEFNPYSLASVTPYAVVLAGLLGLLGRSRLSGRARSGLAMVYVALAAGFAVGLLNAGPAGAGFALLEWASPFLVVHYALVRGVNRALLGRGLWLTAFVVGAYGTFQYYVLPAWDKFWLAHAPINSAGHPVAGQFRVFSTLNSPGTMAVVLAVLVLLLLASFRPRDLVALVPAFAALSLSLVRASWLIVAVGIVVLVLRSRGDWRSRRGLVALAVAAVALVVVSPGQTLLSVGDRLGTAGELSSDQSFNSRVAFFEDTLGQALLTPAGYGLGSTGVSSRLGGDPSTLTTSFDNGVLNIPFTLGWVGSILFVAGAVVLYRSPRVRQDAGRAPPYGLIVLAAVVGLLFVNILTGASGYFLGLVLALHLRQGLPQGSEEPSPVVHGTPALN